MMGSVTPRELAAELANSNNITLIDVREPWEFAFARLPEARLIPLDDVPDTAATIDPDTDVVVYCHHGVRSAMAAQVLLTAGVRRVRNLVGGIDRWSTDVDPQTPRY